jgi:hypothetical protein
MNDNMNEITAYQPILGCSYVQSESAQPYHHRWLVINNDRQLMAVKQLPALALVEVSLKFGQLALRSPGMMRLDIPLDVIEDDDSVRQTLNAQGRVFDVVDEGNLPAAWFSNVCGESCRLVKVHPDSLAPNSPVPLSFDT